MNCIKCGKEIPNGETTFDGKCYMCDIKERVMKQSYIMLPDKKQKILLIEDGSVDTSQLDTLGINYIVYKQGSAKPEIIEI